MKKTLVAIAAVAAMGSTSAFAGDVAAGKTLFANSCASCHGVNAEGQGMFPKLAGQAAADVTSKLNTYKSGGQVGPMTSMMAPMAMGLSDADIANVAAYLASK